MSGIPPHKRRSRRLRKKLHVDEFQEWGFEFAADLIAPMSPEDQESLCDLFLFEVVAARKLALGGWITGGFVAADGRASTSDEDRASVQQWLSARPEIKAVQVGPLVDAWYFPASG